MQADLVARLRLAVAALEEKKGYHLLALDVSERTSIARFSSSARSALSDRPRRLRTRSTVCW